MTYTKEDLIREYNKGYNSGYNFAVQEAQRDEFAISAMQGMMASPKADWTEAKQHAKWAYQIADAMLDARKLSSNNTEKSE